MNAVALSLSVNPKGHEYTGKRRLHHNQITNNRNRPIMSKAVTAEAHKISSTVAKHATKKDLIETAVFKATQSTKEVPPKEKHMRSILIHHPSSNFIMISP